MTLNAEANTWKPKKSQEKCEALVIKVSYRRRFLLSGAIRTVSIGTFVTI